MKELQKASNALFILVICLILAASFVYQFLEKSRPCELCLLQRAAMLGVVGGLLLNVRFGIRVEHYAISLAHALFGLLVALYQISLHTGADRNAHMQLLGHPLFVWSFYIFLASLLALFLLLYLVGTFPEPLKARRKRWEAICYACSIAIVITCLLSGFLQ